MVNAQLFSLEAMGARPTMNPKCIVSAGHWRIGILTASLIRFEWSASGQFVDDTTPLALNRFFEPPTQFAVEKNEDGSLLITTEELEIRYDGKAFSREGLSIYLKHFASQESTWHFGDDQSANMGGTTRTLDQIDGAAQLDPGLMSKNGWAILDDSSANVIRRADTVNGTLNPFGTWVFAQSQASQDFYFFGYGGRIKEAVRDFYHLTGHTPLLPRFALGNWWSRYHAYSQDEYEQLIERFEQEGIPFSVAVIDMDWHLVDIDSRYGSGWTGYTWNRDLFPDPQRFLTWLHEHGLMSTLSLHPRDGVRAFEDQYSQVAEAMGVKAASEKRIDFDLTDPKFMSIYFDTILHPMEDEGVDFWWIDWQQGSVTKQPGLDPMWMLNHLHYLDSARRSDRRPLTFSRYAGPGSHRYPVGFSGDTVVSWQSLRFQPYFTAMASNIGYGWWSHDIGGHMFGYRDEQLEARWYQLGTFSPINRLHSTNSPFNGKEPWNFHAQTRSAMTTALRLRHELIPYLYTMNRRAAYDDLPLIEPMYWNFSGGNVPTQYQFGTELIVSPVLEANDPVLQRGRAQVWFPQGTWFDCSNGRRYEATAGAGRLMEVWRTLDQVPVFAKAGGIVPLQMLSTTHNRAQNGNRINMVSNPEDLRVLVFPGESGLFDLWEDNGAQQGREHWAKTSLILDWGQHTIFTIGPAADAGIGNNGGNGSPECSSAIRRFIPERRHWQIVFRGIDEPDKKAIKVTQHGQPVESDISYNAKLLSLTVDVNEVDIAYALRVDLGSGIKLASNPVQRDAFEVLNDAQMLYYTKECMLNLIEEQGIGALAALHTLEMAPGEYGEPKWFQSHVPQTVINALAEILTRS
ncbi:alpha-glucosidase [Bombiscardovia nodaiensis]|uniref:Alpha-glucosidase n=1 Tax=Bombiscardovia nodaiensis TaxID=2932181 RepID=A0ABM8B9G8_9BIFI|nr:alpha-glucosidase [Bombiscardovia nodaiensis]